MKQFACFFKLAISFYSRQLCDQQKDVYLTETRIHSFLLLTGNRSGNTDGGLHHLEPVRPEHPEESVLDDGVVHHGKTRFIRKLEKTSPKFQAKMTGHLLMKIIFLNPGYLNKNIDNLFSVQASCFASVNIAGQFLTAFVSQCRDSPSRET